MDSKIAKIKKIVLNLLADGKEYSSDEIRNFIKEEGVELDKKSSALRTAIYQLRNSGVEIYSRDRGVYQIREKKRESQLLKDFITLMPEQKITPRCVYVHSDGTLVLNGKLNNAIETRKIELKINVDGKKLALIPEGENCHKFTKNGCTKNMEVVKRLKSSHISIPATFEMELDKESGIWIGSIRKNMAKSKLSNQRKSSN